FKGTRPTDPSDKVDSFFLEVDVYTEDGSGQERLANAFVRDDLGRKMRPLTSKKLIRPSLLRSITRPSAEGQLVLLQRFNRIDQTRKPQYEKPSIPTEVAMSHLQTDEDVGRKAWWKRLLGD
ncbi:hypothetical protein LCGC14_2973960, partial [marine sediment metagenome]